MSASSGEGCSQPHSCQASFSAGQSGWQRSLDASVAYGDRDICRGVSRSGGQAAAAAPASAAPELHAQQPPGSGPPTPEAPCDAPAEADELHVRYRAAAQAGQAPVASAGQTVGSANSAAGAGERSGADYLTLRRMRSFVHCVAGSPIVQSALLFLEYEGEHPTALQASQAAAAGLAGPEAAGLEWTLAQMLALWLRAGYKQACESALLGALWVLESAHSAWRSPATVCLSSYTKFLGAISSELVRTLTVDWTASFKKMKHVVVEGQLDLLQRSGWRVRLDLAADVAPCHAALFDTLLLGSAQPDAGPQQAQQAQQEQAHAGADVGAAQQQWAASMRQLCASIRDLTRRLEAHQRASGPSRLPTPDCEDEPPAKRRRAAAA
ncbi:hypothetical protein C2E21_3389 [Chlorella sorokiniana]|uniref:Uncharacterized protein n=1 Tax=Chlorella sorokiniana TaxID=3076 RepID=A0A2P6TU38_CHLSO|nr:hypothetical protein C2E21_3389 [Chlorella sorokiniana]|eukprot:PRW57588.1 hypothetical protein C2E21_3389 [Chlorella sorokiniana]